MEDDAGKAHAFADGVVDVKRVVVAARTESEGEGQCQPRPPTSRESRRKDSVRSARRTPRDGKQPPAPASSSLKRRSPGYAGAASQP